MCDIFKQTIKKREKIQSQEKFNSINYEKREDGVWEEKWKREEPIECNCLVINAVKEQIKNET